MKTDLRDLDLSLVATSLFRHTLNHSPRLRTDMDERPKLHWSRREWTPKARSLPHMLARVDVSGCSPTGVPYRRILWSQKADDESTCSFWESALKSADHPRSQCRFVSLLCGKSPMDPTGFPASRTLTLVTLRENPHTLFGKLAELLLWEILPLDIKDSRSGEILVPDGSRLTPARVLRIAQTREHLWIEPSPIQIKIKALVDDHFKKGGA